MKRAICVLFDSELLFIVPNVAPPDTGGVASGAGRGGIGGSEALNRYHHGEGGRESDRVGFFEESSRLR